MLNIYRYFQAAALILIIGAGINPLSAPTVQDATVSLIREEQGITVNGIPEVWRLQWRSPPKPGCGAEEGDLSLSCPCIGFAYGESGVLDLVRIVRGRTVERLPLTPLFENTDANKGGAIVQRWAPQESDSSDLLKNYDLDRFSARIHARPIVRIMELADYDNDGKATEFFLQTDTLPCGKITGIVIGVTKSNARLHVFGTADHPTTPLVMQKREWAALRKANRPVEVLDWPCGDHGAETQTFLKLSAINGAIHAVVREFECEENGKHGRLIREEPR